MKLYKCRLIPLILTVFIAFSTTKAFSQDKSASPASEATAAVWDLENLSKSTISDETIIALTQHIRIKVFSILPDYRWIERGRIKEVLDEQKFQASGCTDQSCAVEMGQLLGARKMVTGSLSKTGSTYNLTLSVIDIETGLVDKNASEICSDCTESQLYQLAEKTVLVLSGRSSPQIKPVKPAYTGPLVKKGRINLDINFPGAGFRYFLSDKTAVEARGQFETVSAKVPGVDNNNKGTAVRVYEARIYRYTASSRSALQPYFCLEGDYINFNSTYSDGKGYATGIFGGIEYFLGRGFSVQTDIGATYIEIKDTNTAFTDSGIDYIMNFGINIYLNK